MAVFEAKAELSSDQSAVLDSVLVECEATQWMIMEDKATGSSWLTGYFQSEAEAIAAWTALGKELAILAGASVRVVMLQDQDWKESYKQHFRAWRFGALHWVPVWERSNFVVPAGETVLWLDPGMAFGTGNHETTRLVVERLVEEASRATGGLVIDAGCGSGILALSAAKLGFRQIEAFDNDPVAVDVSRENATLNELDDAVTFRCSDLAEGLSGRSAAVVLANIQADILVRSAELLIGAVAPKGLLILSGILAQELPGVRSSFEKRVGGWSVASRTLGEWSDLVLRRP